MPNISLDINDATTAYLNSVISMKKVSTSGTTPPNKNLVNSGGTPISFDAANRKK
jgi:hypothetical protein